MNSTLQILKIEIENYRDMLAYLLSLNSPSCLEVLNCSQELDTLLVRYENLILMDKKLTHKKAS